MSKNVGIGKCYLCGFQVYGDSIDKNYDDQGELLHESCRLKQIEKLERMTDALKKPSPTIQITSDGLEPELEKIMFDLIEKMQIKAYKEGVRCLLQDEYLRPVEILADFHMKMALPSNCYICDKPMGNDIDTFFVDANGNIVHETCYKK